MSGHVFVVNGDLTKLACDAWLLPTDDRLDIESPWAEAIGLPPGRHEKTFGSWAGERVRLWDGGRTSGPAAWLADIGRAGEKATWYAEGAKAFVTQADDHLGRPGESPGRRPALLALPLVGTRRGGAKQRTGEVLVELFRTLHGLVAERRVDVVLVCFGAKPYGAAQRARLVSLVGQENMDRLEYAVDAWDFPSQAQRLKECARRLGGAARAGQLSLFAGAGVSVGAGLPGWDGLLVDLAAQLDEPLSEATLNALPDLRDRAALLELRYAEEGKNLKETIAERLRSSVRCSLQHALLTSLPVTEFVTTNFETLLQAAATSAGRDLVVLPPAPSSGSEPASQAAPEPEGRVRWLLQLHGSVDDPDSLVFTRGGYSDAMRHRGALFGLVQAMMLTRKMLFVGYSLRDEDFHELVHEVRLALPRKVRNDLLGTALTLHPDEAQTLLWQHDVDVVPMAAPDDDVALAARELERFLDLVGLLAADRSAFLLDPEYEGMLTADERELRERLAPLASGAIKLDDHRDGWVKVATLLRELGAGG